MPDILFNKFVIYNRIAEEAINEFLLSLNRSVSYSTEDLFTIPSPAFHFVDSYINDLCDSFKQGANFHRDYCDFSVKYDKKSIDELFSNIDKARATSSDMILLHGIYIDHNKYPHIRTFGKSMAHYKSDIIRCKREIHLASIILHTSDQNNLGIYLMPKYYQLHVQQLPKRQKAVFFEERLINNNLLNGIVIR